MAEGQDWSRSRLTSGSPTPNFPVGGDPVDSLGGASGSIYYFFPDNDGVSGFSDEVGDGAGGYDPVLDAQVDKSVLPAGTIQRDTDSLIGAMVTVIEGTYAGFQSILISNENHEYVLRTPTPALLPGGTRFFIAKKNAVFPDVTAAQSDTGVTQYRCMLGVHVIPAVTLNDVRQYLILNDPGDCDWFLSTSNQPPNDQVDEMKVIADEFTAPELDFSGGLPWADGAIVSPTFFGQPVTYEQGLDQPRGGGFAVMGTSEPAPNYRPVWVWLKRVVRPNARKRDNCWITVVTECSNTGFDPEPLRNYTTIGYDIAGFTEELSLTVESVARIGGGAVVSLTSQGDINQIPKEGSSPILRVKSGDPGSIGGTPDPQFDENGEASVFYIASTDPADEGITVEIEAHV